MLNNVEPLQKWPEKDTLERKKAPFGPATWEGTLKLLSRELKAISARDITLRTMHSADDVRLDGKLKGDSRAPKHPGVMLTFERFEGLDDQGHSKFVALRFPCDTFTYWKDNVRAIALALEALRKVDRYGVRSGSQYAGFKALPAGDFTVEITPELAADFIAKAAGMGNVPSIANSILATPIFAETVYKTAAKALHPDKGGNADEFKKLESAIRLAREVQKQKAAGAP